MIASRLYNRVSMEQCLQLEAESEVKHEYVGGVIYAMAGGRNQHNSIASNIVGFLIGRLRGRKCWPFNSDTKIRIEHPRCNRFYYPDAMVTCRPNPAADVFQDSLIVVFEVVSESSRRIDDGEKKDAYQLIPSLSVYVIAEQDSPSLVVYRRSGVEFDREIIVGLDAILPLPEIETELPLSEIYDGIMFEPEPVTNQNGE